ncbi:hypothetical protein MTO96_049655 [Rhipicephalus appendiculatus]
MVMNRPGEDLQNNPGPADLALKSAFSLGIRVFDVYECAGRYEYIHADVNAFYLVRGFGGDNGEKVYLMDHSTASWYTQNGKHKNYKEYTRKAHSGKFEFRSGEARIGAPLSIDDLEILGYILLQCLFFRVPSKVQLQEPRVRQPTKDHTDGKHHPANEQILPARAPFHMASTSSCSTWHPCKIKTYQSTMN